MSEQKENLRKAEASLQDAEKRLAAVRKWQPLFKQAVLEYHGEHPAAQGRWRRATFRGPSTCSPG